MHGQCIAGLTVNLLSQRALPVPLSSSTLQRVRGWVGLNAWLYTKKVYHLGTNLAWLLKNAASTITPNQYSACMLYVNTYWLKLVGPIANLKGPYFQPSLSVCLCVGVCVSVCLWLALLPFNVDRFWRNFVTRTLLWSSLATTIMVQIGRRGTARRLFENFKKFWKITVFEFQNSGPSFFASVSPVYCKRN